MSTIVDYRKLLILFGERDGARTHDLLIKSQLLYHLSYALALPEKRADPIGGPERGQYRSATPGPWPATTTADAVRLERLEGDNGPRVLDAGYALH